MHIIHPGQTHDCWPCEVRGVWYVVFCVCVTYIQHAAQPGSHFAELTLAFFMWGRQGIVGVLRHGEVR